MTVKYTDTYSKKWSVALAGTLSGMYLFFILPFHFIFASWLYVYRNDVDYGIRQQDIPLVWFIWASLLVVISLTTYAIYRQNKNIKSFTSYFERSETNVPLPSNIAKAWTGLSYLALDTRRGTLLYINHPDTTIFNFFFPKDIRVMGFGMYDWKSIEVEGNTLRIYTGIPELPSVAISTAKASQLYEKINAMRNQTWTYENNIPGYVEHQAKRIADEQGLNLILPPN
jgi:hypothetical protein